MAAKLQAFFNGLLRDWGVKDARVVEMFSVSIDDLQLLPYVYVPDHFSPRFTRY